MPTALKLSSRYLNADRQNEIVENFPGGLHPMWTAAGTASYPSILGGGIRLTSGAISGNVASLTQNSKPFIVGQNDPMSAAYRLQYAEAGSNTASVYLGFSSEAVATAMQAGAGGPPASYTGFGFFKASGSTLWSVESSVAGAQTTTELSAANSLNKVAQTAGGSAASLFEIDVIPKTSAKCDVLYRINGIYVAKHTDFTYTSAAACALIFHIQTGAAVAEVATINLIKAAQVTGATY